MRAKSETEDSMLQAHDRTLGPDPQLDPRKVMTEVQDRCRQALGESTFFSQLTANKLNNDALKYVFGQFYLWRNKFHTWFGLAIEKSGTCTVGETKEALITLAEHIIIEMRESHDLQYRQFLLDLGFTANEIQHLKPSPAT